MKKLELIFIGFAILGIALKLFNVVGSAILLTLSLSMLSILYYLLGFSLFNGIRLRDIFKKKGLSRLQFIEHHSSDLAGNFTFHYLRR